MSRSPRFFACCAPADPKSGDFLVDSNGVSWIRRNGMWHDAWTAQPGNPSVDLQSDPHPLAAAMAEEHARFVASFEAGPKRRTT